MVEVKKQCWANSQYFRRKTLEVVGLKKSLSNDERESKICDILNKLGCDIAKVDLDACHWLKDKEGLILKFCKRRIVNKYLGSRMT